MFFNSFVFFCFFEFVFFVYMYYFWFSSFDYLVIIDWVDMVKYVNDKINGLGFILRVIMINFLGILLVGYDRLIVD